MDFEVLEGKGYTIPKELIKEIKYYLTKPDSLGNVNLGAKCFLTNGKIYANIFQIPLVELKSLIERIEHGT